MRRPWLISRRTALKAIGLSLALPLLETMGWAEEPVAGGGAAKPPMRLAFLYFPTGVYPKAFWPTDPKDFTAAGTLPPTLEPLRPVLGECLLLDGINNRNVFSTLGPAHGKEASGWLTAIPAAGGGIIQNAITADQIAAQRIGQYTPIPSLELGTMPTRMSGVGENGFADAYKQTISYSSPTQPLPTETSPRALFQRLFSSRKSVAKKRRGPAVDAASFAGNAAPAAQEDARTLDQSMLDLVMESAGDLRGRVSIDDQRKLDEYLDCVRSLEKRVSAIERQQAEAARAGQAKADARKGMKYSDPIDIKLPAGEPDNWQEHLRLMADLMILAFQTDITRITTLAFTKPYGRSYPELGFSDNHHDLSHHEHRDTDKIAKLCKIERYNVEQLAYILQRMKSLREGDRSLLDNSIVLWGSGLGDGATHSGDRLPTIVAGRGGGTVRTGRYVQRANGNQADLLMGILARAGVVLEKPIGDGTKLLPDLS